MILIMKTNVKFIYKSGKKVHIFAIFPYCAAQRAKASCNPGGSGL